MEQIISNESITYNFHDELKKNSSWFKFMGIASLLLGIVAIIFPMAASVTIELMVGWILLIGGVLNLIHSFRLRKWNGFGFTLVTSLLMLLAGSYLVGNPIEGTATLTYLLAIMFLVAGSVKVLLSLQLKPADRWGVVLFNGLIILLLGLIILSGFPSHNLWILGLLVGVDLIFAGITFLAMSSSALES